jgi:hypothetical protein
MKTRKPGSAATSPMRLTLVVNCANLTSRELREVFLQATRDALTRGMYGGRRIPREIAEEMGRALAARVAIGQCCCTWCYSRRITEPWVSQQFQRL